VTMKQLEAQLARLAVKITACQTELAELKARRQEVKTRLEEAKRAIKEGKAPPTEPEGLAERVGSVLTENVIEPIAELLRPATEKP
jgi:chaperonin cofactor prefoldin